MENSVLFKRIEHSFERQAFLSLIGARLESVEAGAVAVSCQRREALLQQQGLLHGGVVTTLADVACGYAALTLMPEDSEVLTVELKINLMRPAAGQKVTAAGRVLKAGKTLTVAESMVTDEGGTLLAKMTATMIAVKGA